MGHIYISSLLNSLYRNLCSSDKLFPWTLLVLPLTSLTHLYFKMLNNTRTTSQLSHVQINYISQYQVPKIMNNKYFKNNNTGPTQKPVIQQATTDSWIVWKILRRSNKKRCGVRETKYLSKIHLFLDIKENCATNCHGRFKKNNNCRAKLKAIPKATKAKCSRNINLKWNQHILSECKILHTKLARGSTKNNTETV